MNTSSAVLNFTYELLLSDNSKMNVENYTRYGAYDIMRFLSEHGVYLPQRNALNSIVPLSGKVPVARSVIRLPFGMAENREQVIQYFKDKYDACVVDVLIIFQRKI